MTRRGWSLFLIFVVPFLLSCASSTELARRSETALSAHDYDRAYQQARASLDKDPSNGRARMALSAAAWGLLDQQRRRVIDLATVDTVEAAQAALDVEVLRAQAIRYGATLAADSLYGLNATRIRHAAAVRKQRLGREALKQDRPKHSFRELTDARRFEPELKGLDEQIGTAWDRALTRVAILPFEDATGTRGLARDVVEHLQEQLTRRAQAHDFTFVQLIPLEKVYTKLRVSDLGRLTRDDAIELGHALGAREVVWGRLISLHTDSNTDRYHGSLWRKIVEKDSTGEKVRYDEHPFEAVRRMRTVTLAWSWSVIDVDQAETRVGDEAEIEAEARSVYSHDMPEGKAADFVLVPPSMKATDAQRCARAEAEWKDTFQSWSVPKLLEEGRRNRERTHYDKEYRNAFIHPDSDHPVWFDDLPSSGELARIALEDAWQPVLVALKNLDPED